MHCNLSPLLSFFVPFALTQSAPLEFPTLLVRYRNCRPTLELRNLRWARRGRTVLRLASSEHTDLYHMINDMELSLHCLVICIARHV